MATIPASASQKKLSFAKVVASQPAQRLPQTQSQAPAQVQTQGQPPTSTQSQPQSAPIQVAIPNMDRHQATPAALPSKAAGSAAQAKLEQGMKDLTVSSGASSTPSLVVNGSSAAPGDLQGKNDHGTSVSDDNSQRADSNSEMGAKAPSVDGNKSITSGTTFALDEKESLRPDDSASVKAAADDDEAFSIRSSLVTGSRMGSDIAKVHRLRLGDMPERRIVQLLPEMPDQGVETPQSAASSQQPPPEPSQTMVAVSTPGDFPSVYGQNPDEKLLEAMQSPKDRLFLLRLEQDVINFVQSSKEPYMDLPPNNSFCRMLTHKLADYYHMTHSFEAVQGAVRIYRTPFCRVPPSLASISETATSTATNSQPPPVLPKKIMRRGEEGSGHPSSNPSKATSDAGGDGDDRPLFDRKLTREEREEAYNKARERIFGTSDKTGETTPDDSNGVSRASSVSAKDKSTLGKRGKTGKQRRDDSESFDSRSQYQVFYGPPQGQPGWTPQYIPVGNPQYNQQMQQPYQAPMPTAYPPAPQAYPNMMPGNGYQQYGNMPAYPQQPQQTPPRYPPSSAPMSGYGSPMQNQPPPQSWQPGYNQAPSPVPYPNRSPQPQPPATMANMNGIPYAFGQLPVNVNPHDPKSQHPIPGSYNRHAFNPKTQSFVPGSGMSPVQPTIAPYTMGGPHGSPQVGSPHMGYSGYNSPGPGPVPQPYMASGPGYGMSRQGSSNSLPPYPPHQHMPQHPPAHMPQMAQMPNKPGMPPGPPGGPGQNFTHLPNYGNPATLPQKPPSGI